MPAVAEQAGEGKLTNFRAGAVYLIKRDDEALVLQCRNGDTDAFEELVARHQRVLFNVALRTLGSYEDARDATQNAFVKAYQHLGTFDPGQRFFSWIYRILRNECLNALRSRRPSEPVPDDWPAETEPDTIELAQRQRAVQEALLALTSEYREVLVLRHFTELSYDEIAGVLGLPVKTVKSRLYSARQRLGELLLDWRVTP